MAESRTIAAWLPPTDELTVIAARLIDMPSNLIAQTLAAELEVREVVADIVEGGP